MRKSTEVDDPEVGRLKVLYLKFRDMDRQLDHATTIRKPRQPQEFVIEGVDYKDARRAKLWLVNEIQRLGGTLPN